MDVLGKEIDGAVVVLTLNRARALNALDMPLLVALRAELDKIARDPTVNAVVLAGAGDHFCAGMDLDAIGAPRSPDAPDPLLVAVETFDAIEALPQPVVAAVQGACITGGLELALSCDIVLCSDAAVFGDTHARIGLLPGGGNTQRLPRMLGTSRAKEILFASDYIGASEAVACGLASRRVAHDRLLVEAKELAHRIANNPPAIVRTMKRLVDEGMRDGFGSGRRAERAAYLRVLMSREPSEIEARKADVVEFARKRMRELHEEARAQRNAPGGQARG